MSQPSVLSDPGSRPNERDFHNNHYDANHPHKSKRPRRNQRQQQQAGIRDCYEEATGNTPKLRHDWFFDIPRIQKHHRANLPYYMSAPPPELLSELQHLDAQLQQVKRQFQPASEQCAAALKTTAAQEFEQARRAGNPYEALGETRAGGLNHGLFLNRSAIKLANMDAALKFTLTSSSGSPTFYFADLCAAPGGFSEYLLRRCCHSITQTASGIGCRGYGMSLVGDNAQGQGRPWKLNSGPLLLGAQGKPGVSYHICRGEDGTGDLLQWSNVQCLQRQIAVAQKSPALPQAPWPQVALVCADGGVDAQRNVEHQEGETQTLVVCQVAAALSILQPNGRFVLKLLACQSTPILQRVLQELYDSFETLQVLKPISSRPASAERYLVCSGYRPPPLQLGPAWIQQTMTVPKPVAPELLAFLAQVDRDMLQLNLKACQAILAHLQAKAHRLATPAPVTASLIMDDGDPMEEDDDAWIAQGYQNYHCQEQNKGQKKKKVNVNAYKKAWRLF